METDNVENELVRDLDGVVGCAGFDQVHHFGARSVKVRTES